MHKNYKRFKDTCALFIGVLSVWIWASSVTIAQNQVAQDLGDIMALYAKQGHEEAMGSPFNGVVLVAKDDQILHKKAYGFSNREPYRLHDLNSRFMIGSITKTFTAMLVLQQVEKGAISLDQTISDFLDYYPEDIGRQITIKHLLSNTSGLPHYEGLVGLGIHWRDFYAQTISPENYARLIGQIELMFEPGAEYHYSSLGFVLLGVILEDVTGKSFGALLKEYIIEPLGLKNTGYPDNEFVNTQVAQGYTFEEFGFWEGLFDKEEGVYTDDVFRDQSNTYSTGGMYSSIDDLWAWSRAVKNATLISEELTELMFTPVVGGYGLGWFRNEEVMIRRNPAATFTSHGGGLFGYRSNLVMYDDGTDIIILSNIVPSSMLMLTRNLYLTANGIDIDDFQRDLVRPEIEESLEVFIADGGMPALRKYYADISTRAGYNVLPAQMAYLELITLYLRAGKEKEALVFVDELFEKYSKPAENTINMLGYRFLEVDNTTLAIKYLELNTRWYPYSDNTHDSLAEAYIQAGDYKKAALSYERAAGVAKTMKNNREAGYLEKMKKVKSR